MGTLALSVGCAPARDVGSPTALPQIPAPASEGPYADDAGYLYTRYVRA